MRRQGITSILRTRESADVEVKSARGCFPDSFWETYSAFANTDGGVILLGVSERKDNSLMVEGLADATKAEKDFWNMVNNRQKVNRNIMTNHMVHIEDVEGNEILVVEVPRAERTARPVYKGMNPFEGTYRRYSDGDHLCTRESVGAMMRDASYVSMDATAIKDMDMSVFCQDTVNAYRNVFRAANPNHLWNNLETEVFLRRIKAVDMADDGMYHPTEAGLLMFGYEYEITRRFPQYFLDYQEDRVMIGVTRWKDRIISSSGDWSGNVFDFVFKVLAKLQSDLKVPFVMKGNQRIDDTPIHKLLREATTNCMVHADYDGRQGIVITKDKDGFVFANPGRMRIPVAEAVGGGVSDPRNSTMLKMFSLIRFGERAGSGLNGIMHVWKKVYHTEATILEKLSEVDRTILTLPFGGNEQDVKAMLQFYDNPNEYSIDDFVLSDDVPQNDPQNHYEVADVPQNDPQNDLKAEIVPQNVPQNLMDMNGKEETLEQKILSLIALDKNITREQIAKSIGVSIKTVGRELKKMGNVRYMGSAKSGHWEIS